MLFGEVLEAIDQLSPEEQETLLDIVQHRLVERGRKQLAADIEDARIEFAAGRCQPATVEKLMKELEPLDSDLGLLPVIWGQSGGRVEVMASCC